MKNPITYLEERLLIARFQRGDRAAFDILFNAYSGCVLAFALTLVAGCRADAEDLVQETFLAANQAKGSFRGGSRILTWLLGITLRRVRDGNRRRHPILLSLSDHGSFADDHVSTEQTIIDGIRYQEALALLDEPQRIAFCLVAGQGLTHKETAALLETPVGTVKWRVAQATKHLRAALTEEDETKEKAIPCART